VCCTVNFKLDFNNRSSLSRVAPAAFLTPSRVVVRRISPIVEFKILVRASILSTMLLHDCILIPVGHILPKTHDDKKTIANS
jgi:hypothetical protein